MAQSLKSMCFKACMPNCPISPIMPSKSICTRFQIDIYLCFAALSSTLLQPLKSIFCTSDKCTECLLIISSLACFLRNSCLMPPQFRMTLLSASMLIIHKPSGCEFCCKQKHLKRCTNFLFVYLSYIISKSTFLHFISTKFRIQFIMNGLKFHFLWCTLF